VILDRLANPASLYELPSRLARALDFLRATDMRTVALGRHDLDGELLFALVQEYTTRAPGDCVWEAHRRYIDVQFMAVGMERMGIAPLVAMLEREPYDAARDVAFFEPGTEFVTIREGCSRFGPEDVHCQSRGGERAVPGCRQAAGRLTTASDEAAEPAAPS
jgi:YhcH/YjgK/YiaL family protein